MFCNKCGAQVPDGSVFCQSCGARVGASMPPAAPAPAQSSSQSSQGPILAPAGATQLKCPQCGAPLTPQMGDAVLVCQYCGGSVFLGGSGWQNVSTHSMLPIKVLDQEKALSMVHNFMDKGLFSRHLQEKSTLEGVTLVVVPYWLIPSSARTSVEYYRGKVGGEGRAETLSNDQMDVNYDFPVVAIKALKDYQPVDYQFALAERTPFQISGLKGTKVMNGDVSPDEAKIQAKTLVDQLQYQKAHQRHEFDSIMAVNTQVDVTDGELLHVPVWVVKYKHKNNELEYVVDANHGGLIKSTKFNE